MAEDWPTIQPSWVESNISRMRCPGCDMKHRYGYKHSRCVSARDGAVMSGGNYGNNAIAKTNHVYVVAGMGECGVLSAPCHRHGQYIESSQLA